MDASVGSVVFALSGAKSALATDNEAPYALFAGSGQTLPVGVYTLRATACAEADSAGDELHTLAVSFTVAAGEASMGTVLKLRDIPEKYNPKNWSPVVRPLAKDGPCSPCIPKPAPPPGRIDEHDECRVYEQAHDERRELGGTDVSGPHLFQDGRHGTRQTDHQPREANQRDAPTKIPRLLISSLSQMRHAVMVVTVRTQVSLKLQPGWATSGNPSAMAVCCSSQTAIAVACTTPSTRATPRTDHANARRPRAPQPRANPSSVARYAMNSAVT